MRQSRYGVLQLARGSGSASASLSISMTSGSGKAAGRSAPEPEARDLMKALALEPEASGSLPAYPGSSK
jgi:hypothetical protein